MPENKHAWGRHFSNARVWCKPEADIYTRQSFGGHKGRLLSASKYSSECCSSVHESQKLFALAHTCQPQCSNLWMNSGDRIVGHQLGFWFCPCQNQDHKVHSTQIYKKIPTVYLEIQDTIELAKPVEHLELLMTTNCFVYSRGDHTTVFRELSIVKPLNELTKRGDNWNDSVVGSCIKKLAKCSAQKFLINCRSRQSLQLCFSLAWTRCLSPGRLR